MSKPVRIRQPNKLVVVVPTPAMAEAIRKAQPDTRVFVDPRCPPDAVYRMTWDQYMRLLEDFGGERGGPMSDHEARAMELYDGWGDAMPPGVMVSDEPEYREWAIGHLAAALRTAEESAARRCEIAVGKAFAFGLPTLSLGWLNLDEYAKNRAERLALDAIRSEFGLGEEGDRG